MSSVSSGSMIQKEFLKLLHPFLKSDEDALNNYDDTENSDDEDTIMEEAGTTFSDDDSSSDNDTGVLSHFNDDFEFHITDEQGRMRGSRIKVKRSLFVSAATKKLNVLVGWPDQMIRKYDTSCLSLLPEIFKPGFASKRLHESFSLHKCLEAFLKEEPLGPEDMWYCPHCKKHRQAIKKLDLWRLPEVLVIHLKRFSYSRFLKSKLETYVDFPISDLDLSGFVSHKAGTSSGQYMLYAVSNHYGGMGGGHYTALVYHGGRWYEFDDSSVCPVSEDTYIVHMVDKIVPQGIVLGIVFVPRLPTFKSLDNVDSALEKHIWEPIQVKKDLSVDIMQIAFLYYATNQLRLQ
ncbi:hypothetical protein Ancab_015078 [Ancistrocladus abbreviatus]